ncbi:dihydrolipoyl dehydrogenase [Haploplasma axanthum]|uniref:Dihydrolipoyl dehydrogenase n=1 Tax=Haploplasma axanthum TaxID=29552 RepID=A0A449BFY1_HAPAX|nr:dihydrolipoyl dehydrogenase [Haploplasma axanthum]VEU81315.1 thioredoxin-disulfide reductase [Haploplasma axanthum]
MKNYDIIVLGGGPGGYVAAIKAAQLKQKVALIEKEVVGGICLNHGCIPTKAILKSAKTYDLFKHADKYGITVDPAVIGFDLDKIVDRKDDVVKKLTGGVALLLKKNGVDVYNGYGEVVSPTEVKVNDETLTTKNLIIATGGTAIVPPIPGAKEAYEKGFAVTSRELLQVRKAPKKLVIVGGGVIGVEFATIFKSLGTEVTIVEMAKTIITPMDDEVITAYTKSLTKDGVKILTEAAVKKIGTDEVTYEKDGKQETIKTDLVLIAVGIGPNTGAVSKLGLEMKGRGIKVDKHMGTSIKGVYAIGDVTGEHMLAHVASAEGVIAIENILGEEKSIDYNQIPAAIYGHPEIAMVGLTEREAKAQGLKYTVTKFPLAGNGKALADGETEGFIKMIKGSELDEILGAHIYAYNAVDMIGEIGLAMKLESTNYEVSETIHAHPSLSEIIMEASMDKPIHI